MLADMRLAQLGCAVAVGWLILIAAEILTLFYISSGCNSDACEGWWWLAILSVLPTLLFGVIAIPLGLISANALSKDQREPPA
jgi:hypothetical protein